MLALVDVVVDSIPTAEEDPAGNGRSRCGVVRVVLLPVEGMLRKEADKLLDAGSDTFGVDVGEGKSCLVGQKNLVPWSLFVSWHCAPRGFARRLPLPVTMDGRVRLPGRRIHVRLIDARASHIRADWRRRRTARQMPRRPLPRERHCHSWSDRLGFSSHGILLQLRPGCAGGQIWVSRLASESPRRRCVESYENITSYLLQGKGIKRGATSKQKRRGKRPRHLEADPFWMTRPTISDLIHGEGR